MAPLRADNGRGAGRIDAPMGSAGDQPAQQVKKQVTEGAEPVLDVVAEEPEEPHVAQQVHPTAVHEHAGQQGESDLAWVGSQFELLLFHVYAPEGVDHGHPDRHKHRMRLAELQDSRRHEAVLVSEHLLPRLGQPAHPQKNEHVDRHQRKRHHRGVAGRVVIVQRKEHGRVAIGQRGRPVRPLLILTPWSAVDHGRARRYFPASTTLLGSAGAAFRRASSRFTSAAMTVPTSPRANWQSTWPA